MGSKNKLHQRFHTLDKYFTVSLSLSINLPLLYEVVNQFTACHIKFDINLKLIVQVTT